MAVYNNAQELLERDHPESLSIQGAAKETVYLVCQSGTVFIVQKASRRVVFVDFTLRCEIPRNER
jgi:hypothetical protein